MAKVILTVDDSPSIRQMVLYTLRNAGYDVLEACDGEDGAQMMAKHAVDLVLTDQNMPRLDGLGLIRRIRSNADWARVPILMLTTESSDTMKAQGRAAGATGWLVKPFDPRKLIEVVRKVLP